MSEFHDKVILITGAGKGLGRAIAEAFAARGAIIAANDITPVNLDETVRRITAAGGRARDYVFDAAKRLPATALVEQALADWGRVDVLVNHASVAPPAPLIFLDEWDWQRALDVNLSGPFFLIQRVAPIMRAQGGGSIINIGAPETAASPAYLASKAGLAGLTQAAARELAADNIRVHLIFPEAGAPPKATAARIVALCT